MDKETFEKFRKERLIMGYLILIGLILIFAGTILGYINLPYLILAFIGLLFLMVGSSLLFIIADKYWKRKMGGV